MNDTKIRCSWAQADPLLKDYHDNEWGVPVHDDRLLFEMLTLEAAQAGLSWLTILKKRNGYHQAFDNFDIEAVSNFSDAKLFDLMQDLSIVRNRLKIEATRQNARAALIVQQNHGSLDGYLWYFVKKKRLTLADSVLSEQISKYMSKELKKNGFKFLGPTTCYAFMQAVGMVNGHVAECFRFNAINIDQ